MQETQKNKSRRAGKETLRANIRAHIQKRIAEGVYQPGDRIVETRLAKELNVSQAPVREAILELAAMGVLEERPYTGCIVRKLTAEDIADIYDVRAHIDEYAASLAAHRATDAEFDAMERLLREMDKAADIHEFVQKDILFHAMVVDAAGSPTLSRIWRSLRLAEWTNLSVTATENSLEKLKQNHWKIFHYLKMRDEHAASAYMFLHIKGFGDEMKKHFTDLAPKEQEP